MITNLEKNFEAIASRQFVEEFKKKNKKKEKSVYFNSSQKLWVLSENENRKTKKFIKEFEATLPKKVKKKANDLQDIKFEILSLHKKELKAVEIAKILNLSRKKVYEVIRYNKTK